MPQMRGVMTSASLGSRPRRICSKPRYILPTHQASVTVWSSTSNLISRSPSTRFRSILIIRLAIPRFSTPGGGPSGWRKYHFVLQERLWFLLRPLRLAEQQLVKRELRADAPDTGITDFLGRPTAFIVAVRQARADGLWPIEFIEFERRPVKDHAHGLDHRLGVRRATGNIDYRQTRFRSPPWAEQAARLFVGELQARAFGGIRRRRRNPAEGGASAHPDHIFGLGA